MREKYVEERFSRYSVFGVHADGRVDLASSENSTLATVTPAQAADLIVQRDAAVDMIWRLVQLLEALAPETLTALWYGAEEVSVSTQ